MTLDPDYANKLGRWRQATLPAFCSCSSQKSDTLEAREVVFPEVEVVAFLCSYCGHVDVMDRSHLPKPEELT